MIDWDKTEKQFGYRTCRGTFKVVVICHICSHEIIVTKNRYCQNKIRNNGYYRCLECSKVDLATRTSIGIKKKWLDTQYRQKQENKKHSDTLKKQARDRSIRLWRDDEYKDKFKEGFNPDIARSNLAKARSTSKELYSKIMKEKWKDESYKTKMAQQFKSTWKDKTYRDKVVNGLKKSLSSPEIKLKMSQNAKELWKDENYRKNWLMSFLESFTPERRNKISVDSLKNWSNYEYIEHMKKMWTDDKKQEISNLCREWWTNEKKTEVSRLMLERWSDDKWHAKFISAFINSWTNPERVRKAIEWWTLDRRLEASKRSQLLWNNPEYVKKQLAFISKPSSLENQLADILKEYNVKFKPQVHIGPYLFDFEVEAKFGCVLIEVQGDYWHNRDKTIIKDRAKATYIERYFPEKRLLYIWEHEFYQMEKVRNFVESLVTDIKLIEFEFSELVLDKEINFNEAKGLFEKYHYKSSIGRGGMIIGVRLKDNLIACCVFSSPTRNVSGGELTRFVIHPKFQKKNLASWFLSKASKIALEKFNFLFTFVDPNFNHSGSIYLASNWVFSGETKSDYWYVSDQGWVIHKKTLWNRATNLGMKEKDFAKTFKYKQVWGLPKKKYELGKLNIPMQTVQMPRLEEVKK